MRKGLFILFVIGCFPQTLPADVWQDLAVYKLGDPSNAPDQLDTLVLETPVNDRGVIEDKLIELVASPSATIDGKSFACRMLQRIGTPKCVPALAGLLKDEILSSYARLALQRMDGVPGAGTALRDALESAPDKVKPGLMGSLAERRDRDSVKTIGILVASPNPDVAGAAMRALGLIGGGEAMGILEGVRPPDALVSTRHEALVVCATGLAAEGKASEAAKVLSWVYSESNKESVRIAALSGLLRADQTKAAPLVVEQVKAEESILRQGALRLAATVPGAELTSALTAALVGLEPAARGDVIVVLGVRGDESAIPVVAKFLGSEDETTRKAAIVAVGSLGNESQVKALLEQVRAGGAGDAALDALAKMADPKIDDTLTRFLTDDTLRSGAAKALALRGARSAAPRIMELAGDKNPAVRQGAWAALAQIATENEIDPLMKLLVEIKDEAERNAAQTAIRNVCSEAADRNKCYDVIATFYEQADPVTQLFVLELGPAIGTDKALALERKALKSGNEEHQKKAVRALTAWPNVAALPDLLELAKSGDSDTTRILALRGYIQVAEKERAENKRLGMLKTAGEMAARPDEKRLIVSALRNVKRPESLNMLKDYLSVADIKKEAETAAADLAWDLRDKWPGEAAALSKILMETSDDKKVVRKAEKCFQETKDKKNRK